MSFQRQPSPAAIAHGLGEPVICVFVSEQEIAAVMRQMDPFGVDDPCPFAPDWQHWGVGSCGDVACCYCAKIFWRR